MAVAEGVCRHCGETKSIAELNGYDPLTGDTSDAYCRQLGKCKSDLAAQRLDELVEDMKEVVS